MRPLFISFPLTHVYVGNGKRSGNTIHAIAKSGKSVSKDGNGSSRGLK